LFPPEQLELPLNVGVTAAGEPMVRRQSVPAQLAEGVSMEEWRNTWSAHLQLTRLVDDGIGRILDELDQSGVTDDTVVLFTSDHGDHLGQHSMYQKMEMYEQAIRVPLMIRVPETNAKVVDDPVSHLDILPTFLTCAGVSVPNNLDGIPLQDYIQDTIDFDTAERVVFSQYSGNPAIGDIRRTIITKRFKYVFSPNEENELFDLQADPMEMINLAKDQNYQAVIEELRRKLKEWGQAHGDWIDFAS
jgi:arylsulfatase A-like enzyme